MLGGMRMLELENIIEQIKEVREEKAQLERLFADKVAQYKAALDSRTDKLDKDIYYLTQTARAEFEQLPFKTTKTQREISLLSGDLIIKNATQKLEADKDVLLKSGPAYLVKTTEVKSFDWSAYKKGLAVIDGQVINTVTGEVVSKGVTIIDVAEEVIVK